MKTLEAFVRHPTVLIILSLCSDDVGDCLNYSVDIQPWCLTSTQWKIDNSVSFSLLLCLLESLVSCICDPPVYSTVILQNGALE
jgi:hypothetical protein